MRKNVRYKYICEGETEQKFIKVLKDENLLIPGKVEVFNIARDNVSKVIRKYNKNDFLIFIVDTDILNETIFCKNITLLNRFKFKYCTVFQNKNLEDELKTCCKFSNTIQLFKSFYNTTSANEFKEKLIKDNNLYNKLIQNNFTVDKLWSLHSFKIDCVDKFIICNKTIYKKG